MANAPIQPNDAELDPAPVQGDMPGAYNRANRSRPVQSPPSRVKSVAITIGVAVLALVIIGMVMRDDNPNPPLNPEGDVPVEPRR